MKKALLIAVEVLVLVCIALIMLKGMSVVKNTRIANRKTPLWEGFPGSKIYEKKEVVPRYGLQMKSRVEAQIQKDLQGNKRYLSDAEKKWYKAHFLVDDKEYEVSIRVRGDSSVHWGGKKKSWRVKFKKGEHLNGMREINLILPGDKGVHDMLIYQLAEKMDLLTPRHHLATLDINRSDVGLYWVVEHFGGEMLAHANFTETALFSSIDPWVDNYSNGFWTGIPVDSYHSTLEPSLVKNYLEGNSYSDASWHLHRQFSNAIKQNKGAKEIFKYFDKEKYLDYSVLVLLCGNHHGDIGLGNAKLYFDAQRGVLEPVPWDLAIHRVSHWGRGLDVDTHIPSLRIQSESDAEFQLLRAKRVYDYVNSPDLLTNLKKEFMNRNDFEDRDFAIAPYGTFIGKSLEGCLDIMKHNCEKASAILEHSSMQMTVEKGEDSNHLELTIAVNMFSPVMIQSISIPGKKLLSVESSLANEFPIFISSDRKLVSNLQAPDKDTHKRLFYSNMPIRKEYKIKLKFASELVQESISKLMVEARNAVTNQPILAKKIKQSSFFSQNHFATEKSDEDVLKTLEHLQVKWSDDRKIITFPRQKYEIEETLITPENVRVEITQGSSFEIANGKSILFRGPVEAIGHKDAIISFLPKQKDGWYGTVAILNSTVHVPSKLKYCSFKRGSETWVDYRFFSGTLAMYGGKAFLERVSVAEAKGDDGLNLKYCEVEVKDCLFVKNSSDAIDADFSKGVIKSSQFLSNRGDAVDFSGGDFELYQNTIRDTGDKGVSVGEKTTIKIYENRIDNALTGVAIKDLSNADIYKNIISSCTNIIAAYRKKEYFGGGKAKVHSNIFRQNLHELDIDTFSKVDSNNNTRVHSINEELRVSQEQELLISPLNRANLK